MVLYADKSDVSSDEKSIVLDDMILTKDLVTSAGSKMLEGYKSLFGAEVVTKLMSEGYRIVGKANTGEIALDLLGETSYHGSCVDKNGHLQSAIAEILKKKEAKAAITMDVNGAPRRGAALAGLTYIKPTYGTVSRYGTIPAVCSGEAVGVMAENAEGCRHILSRICGHDAKDGTSLPEEQCARLKKDAERDTVKKVAVVKSMVEQADDETRAKIDNFVSKAIQNGIEVVEIDGKEFAWAQPAWCVLMAAEVCNNVSRYDGVKFGYRTKNYTNIDELYTNSRTEAFGFLLKATILLGSNVLSTENYMRQYDKALRMRRVLCEYMEQLFAQYDAVVLPACSKHAYSREDITNEKYLAYEESRFTSMSSITGLPALVTNGVQVIGKAFSENSLFDMAEKMMWGGEQR